MDLIITIIIGLVSLIIGGFITSVFLRKAIEQRSQHILKEAETKSEVLGKEKILQAKEKFMQLKAEHEKVINERNRAAAETEDNVKEKEKAISQKMEEFQRKETELDAIKENLTVQLNILSKKQDELDTFHKRQVEQLETISSLSVEEAKAELVEALKSEAKTEAMSLIKDIVDEAKLTANKEAKKIVIQTIQRVGPEHAIENSVTVFNIESDDLKGKIIGREGRNIRALEAATGVELIVDDTPEAIVISSFDAVRRELCRLALHQLVSDGRIHPARIEEVVGKTQKQLEELALSYQGVKKAYAIQAGRELRVLVESEKVSDKDSEKLSFEISQKIQSEMTYPGQVKVTVIREMRAVSIAK